MTNEGVFDLANTLLSAAYSANGHQVEDCIIPALESLTMTGLFFVETVTMGALAHATLTRFPRLRRLLVRKNEDPSDSGKDQTIRQMINGMLFLRNSSF